MDITTRLEEYRKKKLKEFQEKDTVVMKTEVKEVNERLLPGIDSSPSIQSEDLEDSIDDSLNCLTVIDMLYYGLCIILWGILYAIFIKLQFGTVFFIVSCLVGIYINTRTSPKGKGEVSAYSVFNKDCKSIDGTLKAEQFEREIRYGPTGMN